MAKKFDRGPATHPLNKSRRSGKLQPPDVWADLRFDPQYNRSFQQQEGVPVDNSKALLRQLSPFTLSILPPLVLSGIEQQNGYQSFLRAFQLAGVEAQSALNTFLEGLTPFVPGNAGAGSGPIDDPTVIADTDLTPHFTFAMFASRGEPVPANLQDNIRKVAENLEIILQVFRELSGNPSLTIKIISGWRSEAHNLSCGGAPNSQHKLGKAADIRIAGFEPEAVVAVLNQLMDSGTVTQGGLGLYGTFSHYDVRGSRKRWESSDLGVEPETTIDKAIKQLPEGPLPSELLRVQEEGGFTGFPTVRIVPNLPPPDIPMIDSALSTTRSWEDAKRSRTRGALRLQGSDAGGRGSNRVQAERFIALGLERRNSNGAFEEPALADRLVAVDIASQLDTILRVPPLTLLINPASFSITHTRVQQFSQRTRTGFLFQAWGEEQPKMSVSGKIGAFMAGGDGAPSGVQFASKRNSASYQNLMSLLGFYKHAGYVYDTIGRTNANHFVGGIAIEYDQWVYVGTIDSFSWGYSDTDSVQGGISFDFEFTIAQMFDNHQPTESLKPLSAPTESPSDNRWVTGSGSGYGVSPQGVDPVISGGGSSLPPDEVAPAGALAGSLSGAGVETAPGGSPSLSTGSTGFEASDEEDASDTPGFGISSSDGGVTFYGSLSEALGAALGG